ncbi:hypothetical protein CEXT_232131 [Caerostris extrusa]|uniref:Uncharacterized protein n=1 Tax=Caerostris extrusa TaxID=172846 RepID=A0AAV4T0J0_CAEEX|nr:hypothetical protein CEXT_232131 [Caerostris extrusa]
MRPSSAIASSLCSQFSSFIFMNSCQIPDTTTRAFVSAIAQIKTPHRLPLTAAAQSEPSSERATMRLFLPTTLETKNVFPYRNSFLPSFFCSIILILLSFEKEHQRFLSCRRLSISSRVYKRIEKKCQEKKKKRRKKKSSPLIASSVEIFYGVFSLLAPKSDVSISAMVLMRKTFGSGWMENLVNRSEIA